MTKCENCLHKKDCIDGANFKNAEKCKRFALSDSAIIKALECCVLYKQICPETCPMADVRQCQIALKKNVFDLIKRQQAQIEALQMDNAQLHSDIINANQNLDHITNLWENEKEKVAKAKQKVIDAYKMLKTAKSGVERLKRKSQLMPLSVYAEPERAVFISDIDNLVKEMGCSDAE